MPGTNKLPVSESAQISTQNLIVRAQAQGVDFGRGNPAVRLRYLVKLGLIPSPQRIHQIQTAAHKKPPKVVGYYPCETLDKLISIHKLQKRGTKFGNIKKDLSTKKLKIVKKPPTFHQINKSLALPVILRTKLEGSRAFEIPAAKFAYVFKGFIIIIAASGLVSVGIIASKNYLSNFVNNKEAFEKNNASSDLIGQVLAASSDTHRLYIDADTQVSGLTVFAEDITAPNVLYGAVGGTGISVSTGQRPTIELDSSAVVTAVNSLAGSLTIKASGSASVSSSGSTITISSTDNNAGGDITAVSAGNGLSGGGSSGDVSLAVALTSSGTSSTTSSASGLEFSSGLSLLRGCTNTQALAWVSTTATWDCTTVGSFTSFTLSGDTGGTDQTISDGNTLEIAGGTGIDTTAGATDTVTITIDSTVATLTGTQTLTNKTLTSPTISTSPTAAGATWADLGSVTTIDINGGTIDGATIGASSAAAGTFTTLNANGNTTLGDSNTVDTLTGNLLTSSITSGATTQDVFTITASSLTTGTALTLTGPTSTGVTDHFVKLSADTGSGASVLNINPDFSGAGVTGYGLYMAATDSTSSANTDYGLYSSLALTNAAAKTGYGLYSTVTSTSTTADTILAGEFLADHNGAISTGTKNVYGLRSQATTDTPTDTGGTINSYGAYLAATGAAGGTSNAYGIYTTASGADTIFGINSTVTAATGTTAYALYADAGTGAGTEYAAVFQNGNVGIGTAAPAQQLHLTKSSGDAAIRFETQGTSLNTGATSPSAGTNAASGGGDIAWSNPGNATADDDSYASVALAAGGTEGNSQYLKVTNFGFSIPSGATIKGIGVIVSVFQDNFSVEFYIDNTVSLVDSSGTINGNNNAYSITLPDKESPYPYGSSSDLWGLTWTAADINDSDFGAVFRVRCEEQLSQGCADSGVSVYVDSITITVYYDNVPWVLGIDNSDSSKFKISQSTAPGTNDLIVFSNDTSADWTFGASGQLTLDASTTANTTTTGVLDLNVSSATTGNSGINLAYTSSGAGTTQYGYYSTFTDSTNSANTDYGLYSTVTSTSTTANTILAGDFLADHNGAISTGTKNVYGLRAIATTDTPADTGGTVNTYGGYFSATGNVLANPSNVYGIYAAASAGDTTFAGVFDGADIRIEATTTGTERLCHSGTDIARGDVTVGDCVATSQDDLAEYYGSEELLEPAEVVVTADQAYETVDKEGRGPVSKAWVKKSTNPYEAAIIGIVSTNPYPEILGEQIFDPEENPVPIALAGRVPVKVSSENGPIQAGDFITSSSTPGVGMKATRAGRVVGMALSSFDCDPNLQIPSESFDTLRMVSSAEPLPEYSDHSGEDSTHSDRCLGKIVVFVNPTFYLGTNLASNGALSSQVAGSSQQDSGDVLLANNQVDESGLLVATQDLDGQILTADQVLSIVEGQIQNLVVAEIEKKLAEQAASGQGLTSNQQVLGSSQQVASPIPDSSQDEFSTLRQAQGSNNNSSSSEESAMSREATDSADVADQTQQTLDELDKLLSTTDLSLSTLTVTGNTNLAQTQIAGTFSQDGTLIIDYGKQINVLGSTLYLQNDPLSGDCNLKPETCILVDIGGGKVTIDNKGNLVTSGKLTASSVQTKELIVYTDEGSANAAGSAEISTGSDQVKISTTALKPNAKVSVTPTGSTGGKILYVAQKLDFEGFTVAIDNGPAENTITFDWFILNTSQSSGL